MPRFLAVVKLSSAAQQDLAGSGQRLEQVRRYLARRGIDLELIFRLDDAYHLLVLEAPHSPTRLLNRALARAWPDPHERPEHARLINADPAQITSGLELLAQPSAARPRSQLPSMRARNSRSSRASRSNSSSR